MTFSQFAELLQRDWAIYFIVYFCAINLLAFITYGIDKQKAKFSRYRISEKTLITLAILGGSIGAFLGMKIFHHKTKKLKFSIGIPAIFVVQVIISILISFALKDIFF